MLTLLPPSELRACLKASDLDRRHTRGLPELENCEALPIRGACSRRGFMTMAGAALAAFGGPAWAATDPLVFSPDAGAAPASNLPTAAPQVEPAAPLRLGQIPADFWLRPRSLRLQRHRLKDAVNVVYWRDGQLVPEGYWQACSLMRDTHANVMTTMDPTLFDILCGVQGYYDAWKWPHPIVVTSGFRTAKTNNGLASEGAAKNSMHLYGRAGDLFLQGIPPRDIASLGVHLAQGGVGFYPTRGFTHLDTGRLRVWKG